METSIDVDSIRGLDAIPSPALLVFRDRVVANLSKMIAIAGSADRLRPHVKTHKMAAIVGLEASMGIRKHKCATIAEAEMIARSGGDDVLIAYPLVGPNLGRLIALIEAYPGTTFRATVDDESALETLSTAMSKSAGRPLPVLVDIDSGMGRTGADIEKAESVYEAIGRFPGLIADGLHAYDGHIRDFSPGDRRTSAREGIEAVLRLRERLESRGFAVPRVILGGTPTFPIHAEVEGSGIECSPGTCVLHDAGYGEKFPDLPFSPAAFILTRVISRPRPGRISLDLGHKAVSADPVGARLVLIGVPDATIGGQSEEHLVVETPHADRFPPGTPLLALPVHICPTVALHQEAVVVEGGQVVDRWAVTARDRRIGI